MDRYKTINENAAIINPAIKARFDSYKPSSTVEDPISNLDRFTPLNDGAMLEDLYGEYVLFSDVLKAVSTLFSAKKRIKNEEN